MPPPPHRSTSSSSSTTPSKLPPSGPRALRGLNGVPPAGSSGFSPREKISFSIPAGSSNAPTIPTPLNGISTLGSFGKVRSSTTPSVPFTHRHTNGFPSSPTAESSRQAQLAHSKEYAGSSTRHPASTLHHTYSSLSTLASSSAASTRDHQANSAERSDRSSHHASSSRHDHREQRSPSPNREVRKKSPSKRRPSSNRKPLDPEVLDFRKKLLPTDDSVRIPISIPLPGLANGLTRARPPHLDVSPFERNIAGPLRPSATRKPSQPPSPPHQRPPTPPPTEEPYPFPPPPDDQPPTPPPQISRRSSTPPPLDFVPLPPPSPPPDPPSFHSRRSLSPTLHPLPSTFSAPASPLRPPEPLTAPPLAPPSPPMSKSTVSSAYHPPLPPSFHFRELPIRRKSPSPDGESEEPSVESSLVDETIPPPRSPSPLQAPSPSRSPTPPPYIPPVYVAPPSTERRPGLGNFMFLHDPAVHGSKGGKEVVKRYDGGSGVDEAKVEDPRLQMPVDVRQRGRGSAKQRSTFHELEYEWDDYSTGPKPPPPPTAVLITGLNPLTTVDQISKFLRSHGRIREIDPKMDLRSGMQLGICWVKFDGPLPGRPGTGHDVANLVVKVCEGQRIGLAGDERIKVVLDGRGLRTEKAFKEEMARRYPPKKVEPPNQMLPPAGMTPSSGAATPRSDPVSAPQVPSVPRPLPSSLPPRPRPPIFFNTAERNLSSLSRFQPVRSFNAPVFHSSLPSRPVAGVQQLSSSFVDAPFAPHSHTHHRTHHDDYRDSYSPRRSRSRSRSYSRCSTCSYSSDSEDERPPYRRRERSPYGGARGRVRGPVMEIRKEDEEAAELMKNTLADNGHSYAFIDANSLPLKSVNEDHLKDHFRAFKPSQVLCNYQGWYILFCDDTTAQRAKLLDNTIVQGHRLVIIVKTPPTARKPLKNDVAPAAANEAKLEKGWRFLTITKKNRPATQRKPSPKAAEARPRGRLRSYSSSSSEDESPRRLSRKTSISSASELSEDEAVALPKRNRFTETPASFDDASSIVPPVDEPMPLADGERELDEVFKPSKKRAAKPKVAKGAKKARITSPVIEVEVPFEPPVIPEVAEIKLDEPKKGAKAAKEPKPKKVPQHPVDKLIEAGQVVDEEDVYWLGQALEAARDGFEPDFSDDEEELPDEKHPLYHAAGAWRAEGWKKVPQIQKSSYLPQRNRAAVSAEDAGALTSGRTARVTGRRLALDMETHRKTAATTTAESDLFAFNQLRIRKKQLRFARSAIEGYGLYAMETILTGEMVCEYVGEICRSAVAEIREQRYLKQGIGSSYLFRIDADAVCDATFRGSVSRLINHSCDPSASAKIISINGHSKIVIYAKRTLHPGDEILYDYKFPLESDPVLRVPCLCGAATCRGWLN